MNNTSSLTINDVLTAVSDQDLMAVFGASGGADMGGGASASFGGGAGGASSGGGSRGTSGAHAYGNNYHPASYQLSNSQLWTIITTIVPWARNRF